MRITQHNGRAGKHGVYSAKHNDRKFEVENADHIDTERTHLNRYWQRDSKASSFEACEAEFYEKHFRAALDAKNERYIKERHYERCQTMDDYRSNAKSCPEETIMQIGKMGDDIDSDKLWKVMVEQVNWEQKRFPKCKYLDIALHRDEEGQAHIHLRKVWVGHDKDGNLVVGQKKALDEMGVQAPDPTKKISKHNNQKMSYTRECREHLISVVKELYPEIAPALELIPKEASKVGMELLEYQKKQELEHLQELEQRKYDLKAHIDVLSHDKKELDENIEKSQTRLTELQSDVKQVNWKKGKLNDELEKLEQKVQSARTERDVEEKKLKIARKEYKEILKEKAKAAKIESFFGKKDEKVTFHKNVFDDLRAIGREVSKDKEATYEYLLEITEREASVKQKEDEIESLHEQATAKKDRYQELVEKQEAYIYGTAKDIAINKIDEICAPEQTSYTRRLEQFIARYTQGNQSLLDVFKAEEQELKSKLNRGLTFR